MGEITAIAGKKKNITCVPNLDVTGTKAPIRTEVIAQPSFSVFLNSIKVVMCARYNNWPNTLGHPEKTLGPELPLKSDGKTEYNPQTANISIFEMVGNICLEINGISKSIRASEIGLVSFSIRVSQLCENFDSNQ